MVLEMKISAGWIYSDYAFIVREQQNIMENKWDYLKNKGTLSTVIKAKQSKPSLFPLFNYFPNESLCVCAFWFQCKVGLLWNCSWVVREKVHIFSRSNSKYFKMNNSVSQHYYLFANLFFITFTFHPILDWPAILLSVKSAFRRSMNI